ncbi:MAG: ABC transporter ATP-binding protein [Oscillospiraceae bacterium]|nr:ABC transporter ATP-binding protein [Oscillospiraceae bacterium]
MLEVKDLRVSFHTYSGEVQAVRGVNFTLEDGDILAIVGESGCGKSVTAQSIMRLHDPDITQYKGGEILLDGTDILKLTEKEVQNIRGKEIGMIFQDPMTSLNPTMTVGNQIAEVLRRHERDENGRPLSAKAARERVVELLRAVRLPNPEQRVNQFPHEFSGGQRQRVMIAMAMACSPHILIADEPTTALDVTVQAQILDLMKEMQEKTGTSIIMITHDLGVVADIAKRVVVMYGGMVVESGTAQDIFYRPQHPYTHGLHNSVSRLGLKKNEPLKSIEGTPPDLVKPPRGCPFADRCDYAMQICKDHLPEATEVSDGHLCRCWLTDPDCPYRLERRKV